MNKKAVAVAKLVEAIETHAGTAEQGHYLIEILHSCVMEKAENIFYKPDDCDPDYLQALSDLVDLMQEAYRIC